MKFLTRKLVTPADLNPRGTLHGGQLLKWIVMLGVYRLIELCVQ
jgi:acyl-CoA hydrolase